MPNKKDTTKTEDPRKITLEKAPSIFSEPDNLGEALDDLDAYETWTNTDELFNSTDGGRLKVVKHTPYKDADKAKKVKKKAFGIPPIMNQTSPSIMPKPKKKPMVPPVDPALGNKIDVKAAKDSDQMETKKIKNIDLDDLMELLKDSDAYYEYLGLGEVDFGDTDDDLDEFPMDDKTAQLYNMVDGINIKLAEIVPLPKANPAIPPPSPTQLLKKRPLVPSPLSQPIPAPPLINQQANIFQLQNAIKHQRNNNPIIAKLKANRRRIIN